MSLVNKNSRIPGSIAVILAAMLFFCEGANAQCGPPFRLGFNSCVGNELFRFDTVTYTNSLGQPFVITNFKYYISNIQLTDINGQVYIDKEGYYLIDFRDSSNIFLTLKDIEAGPYTKISFTIGVDSLHNCSGAQEGALDPVNAMFWTWNTGYIFLKMEGKSTASKSPGHIFEYHIGGYKEPNNSIRRVTLDIPPPKDSGFYKIEYVGVISDVEKLLSANNIIDFSKLSSVTDFHNAKMIADNYKEMFRISFIESSF